MPGVFSQALADPIDTIIGVRIAKDILGDLFDQVGVRRTRAKERDFVTETGPGLFQAFGLEFKNGQTRLQIRASLHAVSPRQRVVGKIGAKSRAAGERE